MQPFIHQYLPKNVQDIIGQDESIRSIDAFLKDFKKQKKRALLVYGPSGTGKTSSIYCLAKAHNLDVLEVNASEFRDKASMDKIVGGAIGQQSLFAKGKLILIDEIDGISGSQDRGGLPEIVNLIKKTTYPMILTATNPWDNKFSTVRSNSVMVEFKPLDYNLIFEHLKKIATNEKIVFDETALKMLARGAGGDMRAALNDLQIVSAATKEIKKEDLEVLGQREKEETIIQALKKVLKTTDPEVALTAFDNITEDVDEQLLWLDKNLPEEYKNKTDLARAYEYLSKADIFHRRIRRWQHWRFLVYINAFLTAGVAVSKDKRYEGFTEYKPTGRLLKLYWANIKQAIKKAIAEKLAKHTHTSTKEALKSVPFLKNILAQKEVATELQLDEEELEYLKK